MNGLEYANGPVFWTIVALGAVAVLVYLSRLLAMRRMRVDYFDFIAGVRNVLEKGNSDEALVICDETPGPLSNIVSAAVRHRDGSARALRDAVDMTGRAEITRIERRLQPLAIVAQVAPLLGLLGTVLGLISVVVDANDGGPVSRVELLSAAARTLACAAAGLIVAIPSHVMYSTLMLKVNRFTVELESAASEIVGVVSELKEKDRK